MHAGLTIEWFAHAEGHTTYAKSAIDGLGAGHGIGSLPVNLIQIPILTALPAEMWWECAPSRSKLTAIAYRGRSYASVSFRGRQR